MAKRSNTIGHGIEKKEIDAPNDWANEMVMMGLRLETELVLTPSRRYVALWITGLILAPSIIVLNPGGCTMTNTSSLATTPTGD